MLTNWKNMPFYKVFGRNRSIETIDGYDETVHRGPFWTYRSRRICDEAVRWSPMRCVIKCLRLAPLDCDLTIRMLPVWLNHGRYNAPIYATCVWWIRWTASPCDPRATIVDRLIRRSSFSHVSYDLKYRVN